MTINLLRRLCNFIRCRKVQIVSVVPSVPMRALLPYEKACEIGDVLSVKSILAKSLPDLHAGMLICLRYKQTEVAELLMKAYTENEKERKEELKKHLNEYLKIACASNNYPLAELMMKNGANITSGLKVATSSNIQRMLYRYKQKSENIN